MIGFKKYKPSASNHVLLLLAGIVWTGVGTGLLVLAWSWMSAAPHPKVYIFAGTGLLLALLIHHFGFLRIVDNNVERLLLADGKKCLFSFFPGKTYIIVIIMMTLGTLLRHSTIPKPYLAILYIGIGLALILSSIRYLRVSFLNKGRTTRHMKSKN